MDYPNSVWQSASCLKLKCCARICVYQTAVLEDHTCVCVCVCARALEHTKLCWVLRYNFKVLNFNRLYILIMYILDGYFVSKGTELQAGRSRIRYPIGSLIFFFAIAKSVQRQSNPVRGEVSLAVQPGPTTHPASYTTGRGRSRW